MPQGGAPVDDPQQRPQQAPQSTDDEELKPIPEEELSTLRDFYPKLDLPDGTTYRQFLDLAQNQPPDPDAVARHSFAPKNPDATPQQGSVPRLPSQYETITADIYRPNEGQGEDVFEFRTPQSAFPSTTGFEDKPETLMANWRHIDSGGAEVFYKGDGVTINQTAQSSTEGYQLVTDVNRTINVPVDPDKSNQRQGGDYFLQMHTEEQYGYDRLMTERKTRKTGGGPDGYNFNSDLAEKFDGTRLTESVLDSYGRENDLFVSTHEEKRFDETGMVSHINIRNNSDGEDSENTSRNGDGTYTTQWLWTQKDADGKTAQTEYTMISRDGTTNTAISGDGTVTDKNGDRHPLVYDAEKKKWIQTDAQPAPEGKPMAAVKGEPAPALADAPGF